MKKDKSKLNKEDFNFCRVFRYVNKYTCLCVTHKLNRLMKDGTFFQPCASHITKK